MGNSSSKSKPAPAPSFQYADPFLGRTLCIPPDQRAQVDAPLHVIAAAAARIFASLPETVFLRTADCLHLVTAVQHNLPEIFTHDKHQIAASQALGIVPVVIRSSDRVPPV
jgi:hypothetical protein